MRDEETARKSESACDTQQERERERVTCKRRGSERAGEAPTSQISCLVSEFQLPYRHPLHVTNTTFSCKPLNIMERLSIIPFI